MGPLLALLALGCTPGGEPDTGPGASDPVTVEDLWEDADLDGEEVALEVVVTSPRTADGTAFFARSREGAAGLRVLPVGLEPTLPPAVGRALRLTGEVDLSGDGPALWIDDAEDAEVLGLVELLPEALTEDVEPLYRLVRLEGVALTSEPDPAGRADLDASLDLGAAFAGPAPGWGATGDLVGVVAEPGRISPRDASDWSGPLEGAPPVDLDLASLRADPPADGTPVRLQGVVQATPWSRGHRWVVVQGGGGEGVWVDAEGWGVEGGATGDVLTWTGEVRTDGEGLRLRTWWEPEVTGAAEVVTGSALEDGALAEATLTGLEGPDDLGWWTSAEGVRLCDRFVPLDAPSDGTWSGAVRIAGDETWLCPLP